MKLTKNILTISGEKQAEIALGAELQTMFPNSPIQCYMAASQLEKAAKNNKKTFITEQRLQQLINKHKTEVDAQIHFTEDGLDCFIRTRCDYLFKGEKYTRLNTKFEKVKKELGDHKKTLIEKGLAKPKSVSYTFECHGEKKN